jgi:hypothetical protein
MHNSTVRNKDTVKQEQAAAIQAGQMQQKTHSFQSFISRQEKHLDNKK